MTSHVARCVPKINSKERQNTDISGRSGLLLVSDLTPANLHLLLNLFQVDVGHGILAIEDPSDLLEGRAFSLDEDEVDPDRLKDIPNLQTQCMLESRKSSKMLECLEKVDLTV